MVRVDFHPIKRNKAIGEVSKLATPSTSPCNKSIFTLKYSLAHIDVFIIFEITSTMDIEFVMIVICMIMHYIVDNIKHLKHVKS